MKYEIAGEITNIKVVSTILEITFTSEIKAAIIDANIFKIYQTFFYRLSIPIYIFRSKETNKNLNEAEKIIEFLFDNGIKRSDKIVGIGGGITTDITAFVVSIYKRGCRLQLIPTTFLAMIDASIGGKTAVNYNSIKNAIGSFYPAEEIIICSEFLKTLPKKEIQNGWAECIKTALIQDFSLKDEIYKYFPQITESIIMETANYKMWICKKDMTDKGERRKLNLGHTFGHILESISDYEISHGESIVWGMRLALEFSIQKNLISKGKAEYIVKFLSDIFPKINLTEKYKKRMKTKALDIILNDKKTNKNVNLILFGNEGIIVKKIRYADEIVDFINKYIEE